MTERQPICIIAKEYMIAATSSRAPYIETDEKALECSFRSLEFVNAMYVGEGSKIPMPKLSETTQLGVKQMVGKGARAGRGLGKGLQGMLRPITVIQKKDKFKLGYKPIKEEDRGLPKRKRKKESLAFSRRREKAQKWTYHR